MTELCSSRTSKFTAVVKNDYGTKTSFYLTDEIKKWFDSSTTVPNTIGMYNGDHFFCWKKFENNQLKPGEEIEIEITFSPSPCISYFTINKEANS